MAAKNATAIRTAADELSKLLHADDDYPGMRMLIDEMLKLSMTSVDNYPRAAVILLERSANFLLTAPALAVPEEVESALSAIGGLKAFEHDTIERLWV